MFSQLSANTPTSFSSTPCQPVCPKPAMMHRVVGTKVLDPALDLLGKAHTAGLMNQCLMVTMDTLHTLPEKTSLKPNWGETDCFFLHGCVFTKRPTVIESSKVSPSRVVCGWRVIGCTPPRDAYGYCLNCLLQYHLWVTSVCWDMRYSLLCRNSGADDGVSWAASPCTRRHDRGGSPLNLRALGQTLPSPTLLFSPRVWSASCWGSCCCELDRKGCILYCACVSAVVLVGLLLLWSKAIIFALWSTFSVGNPSVLCLWLIWEQLLALLYVTIKVLAVTAEKLLLCVFFLGSVSLLLGR